ncbi:MAG: S8 family serine peptidase [Bacteroidales bacterium]|nr:S8 family serine peptidase [Bacteroidales bacterium]
MNTMISFPKKLILLMLVSLLTPFAAFTQATKTPENGSPGFVPGSIIIKVKSNIGPYGKQEKNIRFGLASLDKKALAFRVQKLEKRFRHKPIPENSGLPDLSRIYRLSFPASQNVHRVARAFAADPNIEYAEAIPVYHALEVPNDALYSSQQHLPQIMAPQAWDLHKGEDGQEVIVAIIDSGVDWLHPDLTENCWQNLGEDADGDGVTLEFNNGVWERDPDDLNGIDDDGNGFVDDVIGWDFHEAQTIGNGSNPDPLWGQGPFQHGTHVAGIAAGRTNNGTGIASVSYNVKYLPTQVDNAVDEFIYVWDAIIYAADMGADIINNSWGGMPKSNVGQDAIDYATGRGVIVVCAAGNDNSGDLFYPAAYMGSVSVSALNADDTRASFTNYGISLDIAAPGVGILSTITNNNYASFDGTSMASPMTAGLIALLKSYRPDLTNEQLIRQVIGTADNIDSINPAYAKELGSGRINAYRALADTNVQLPQELRLEFMDYTLEDEDGDGALEIGETVSVSFSMRNYAHALSDNEAVFTLSSIDPSITITVASVSDTIPGDAVFEVSGLAFTVEEGTKPHLADLILEVSSDMAVLGESETEIAALVAPAGFLVWEGASAEQDYSGTFIRDFLEARGHAVYYTNTYPQSFAGFDAVFLSFGNAGEDFGKGTFLSYAHSLPIQHYLENGGTLYSDGAPFLVVPAIYEYPNADVFAALFGADSTGIDLEMPNPLDRLTGQNGTLFQGMEFNGSSQQYNWYIDRVLPAAGATAAFAEEDYGFVSLYHEGDSGQKTFHLGYTLSGLTDENPQSSRYNLMLKVMDFFGYPEGDGYVVANFSADQTEGKPGLVVQFTDWSIAGEGAAITGWSWDFDGDGQFDSDEQNPVWTYTEGGIFDVRLVVYGDQDQDTLVKKDHIVIREGILVYEGRENTNGYSGTFIRDYLQNNWYDNVGYTNRFPESLEGYNAVFLSFGNTGLRSSPLTENMKTAIFNYALDGGRIYLEGGDAMTLMGTSGWVFGLQGVQDGERNEIDDLSGQEDALTQGMQFAATGQLSVRGIDKYAKNESLPGAVIAFAESDYGKVAVQFDGEAVNAQKTFCMSYALADLQDGEGINTRNKLLKRILNFINVTVGIEELTGDESQLKVFPNPAADQITLEFSLEMKTTVVVEMFDLSGRKVLELNRTLSEGIQRIHFNVSGYLSGIYYLRMQAGEKTETIKWVKVN